ncbi:hypothetical protein RR11_1385 [Ruegeria sp. R11]|nr:hypothetical protein RR11_1385 [Ruegeria sp. R11]
MTSSKPPDPGGFFVSRPSPMRGRQNFATLIAKCPSWSRDRLV